MDVLIVKTVLDYRDDVTPYTLCDRTHLSQLKRINIYNSRDGTGFFFKIYIDSATAWQFQLVLPYRFLAYVFRAASTESTFPKRTRIVYSLPFLSDTRIVRLTIFSFVFSLRKGRRTTFTAHVRP